MRRSIAVLVGLLMCSGGVLRAVELPPPKEKWIEVAGPSFTFISQANERKTRKIAEAFERFRQVFLWLNPAIDPRQTMPVRAIVFQDDFTYQPYQRVQSKHDLKTASESFFGPELAYLTLSADWRHGDPLPKVYRAYANFILGTSFPNLPHWYHEGLVQYYGTFRFEGGRSADLGLPSVGLMGLLQGRSQQHLIELLRVEADDPMLRDLHGNALFRAQSWILVHYLMSGDESRKQATAAFVGRLMRGADPEEAFQQSFGITTGAMEEILWDYSRGRGVPYFPIDLDQVGEAPALSVRDLSRGEVLGELGLYLAYAWNPPEPAAVEHLKAATQENPEDGDAWAALAYATEKSGRAEEAAPLFEKAMSLDPTEALSHLLCARHLLEGTADEETRATARRELERASELAPNLAAPRVLLASQFAFEVEPEVGFSMYEEALRVAPTRTDLAHNLVMLALRSDDAGRANAAIDAYLSGAGDQEALARARGAVRRHRDQQETRAHGELYNQAVLLANEGRLEEARDELQSLVQVLQDPTLAQAANDLLAQILERLGGGG